MTPDTIRCPVCDHVPGGLEWDAGWNKGHPPEGWRLKARKDWHVPQDQTFWRRSGTLHGFGIGTPLHGAVLMEGEPHFIWLPRDATIECTSKACRAHWTPLP